MNEQYRYIIKVFKKEYNIFKVSCPSIHGLYLLKHYDHSETKD